VTSRVVGNNYYDIAEMDSLLSVEDRRATLQFTGMPSLVAITKCVESSDISWHWLRDGQMACMGGVDKTGFIWFVKSHDWPLSMKLAFAREIAPFLASRGEFSVFVNEELYPGLKRMIEYGCDVFSKRLVGAWTEYRGVVKPKWALQCRGSWQA